MKENVQNEVLNMRQKASVTQEEFARAIGVTRQTVIAIEKGNYEPSLGLALKLSRLFKASIETLFQMK